MHSHSPETIRIANSARARIKKLRNKDKLGPRSKSLPYLPIADDRAPKRAAGAYIIFVKERFATGDFKGISNVEAVKLIASEWKQLSDAEKKVCFAFVILGGPERHCGWVMHGRWTDC